MAGRFIRVAIPPSATSIGVLLNWLFTTDPRRPSPARLSHCREHHAEFSPIESLDASVVLYARSGDFHRTRGNDSHGVGCPYWDISPLL